MVKTYIFPIKFSRSLSSLCVIYPYRGFSQYTAATKTTKLLKNQKFNCGIMKFKNFLFLLKKIFFSLCCRAAGDVKHTKTFLSLFLLSLCNLPQRKVVSTQPRVISSPTQTCGDVKHFPFLSVFLLSAV